jgi:hypothetical protein
MMISCVDFGRKQPGEWRPDVFRGGNAAPAESPEKARRRGKEAPRFVGP